MGRRVINARFSADVLKSLSSSQNNVFLTKTFLSTSGSSTGVGNQGGREAGFSPLHGEEIAPSGSLATTGNRKSECLLGLPVVKFTGRILGIPAIRVWKQQNLSKGLMKYKEIYLIRL